MLLMSNNNSPSLVILHMYMYSVTIMYKGKSQNHRHNSQSSESLNANKYLSTPHQTIYAIHANILLPTLSIIPMLLQLNCQLISVDYLFHWPPLWAFSYIHPFSHLKEQLGGGTKVISTQHRRYPMTMYVAAMCASNRRRDATGTTCNSFPATPALVVEQTQLAQWLEIKVIVMVVILVITTYINLCTGGFVKKHFITSYKNNDKWQAITLS